MGGQVLTVVVFQLYIFCLITCCIQFDDGFYTQLIIIVLPRHCFRPHCRMKQTSQRKHASIFLDKIDCIYEWHSLYSCVVQKRFHQIAFIWNSYKMKRSLSSHLSFCLTMGSLGGDSSCILLSADTFNDWSNIIILMINNSMSELQ